MKVFAKFSKGKKRYLCKKTNSREMQILGILFSADVGCRTDDYFIAWLDNPKQTGVGGNATTVDLEKGDIIEIRDVWENKETGPVLRMPKEQYRKMMSLWKDLCKVKPKEIIITWNGKEITVEGRD